MAETKFGPGTSQQTNKQIDKQMNKQRTNTYSEIPGHWKARNRIFQYFTDV